MPVVNTVTTLAAVSPGSLTFVDGVPLTIGTVNGTVGVSTSAFQADATIVADAVDVQQPLNARNGNVTLRPFGTSLGVNLGGLDSPTALGLSDDELARITANVLRVGRWGEGHHLEPERPGEERERLVVVADHERHRGEGARHWTLGTGAGRAQTSGNSSAVTGEKLQRWSGQGPCARRASMCSAVP